MRGFQRVGMSTKKDAARPFGLGIFLWLAVAERLPVNSGILGCIFLTGVVYLDLTQKSNKFQKERNHVKG